jgi:hypothetical protein
MTGQPDPAALLQAVADALTACAGAGLKVKLRHGAVYSGAGYVLPAGGGWVARTLEYSPFWPDDMDEDD